MFIPKFLLLVNSKIRISSLNGGERRRITLYAYNMYMWRRFSYDVRVLRIYIYTVHVQRAYVTRTQNAYVYNIIIAAIFARRLYDIVSGSRKKKMKKIYSQIKTRSIIVRGCVKRMAETRPYHIIIIIQYNIVILFAAGRYTATMLKTTKTNGLCWLLCRRPRRKIVNFLFCVFFFSILSKSANSPQYLGRWWIRFLSLLYILFYIPHCGARYNVGGRPVVDAAGIR